MKRERSSHLPEEVLHDVLIGLGTPEAEAHLRECAACRSQVEEFRSTLQGFNEASLAWSEARRRAIFSFVARPDGHPALLRAASWALAAGIVAAIGLPAWNHYHRAPAHFAQAPAATQSECVAPEDSTMQIAQDNELLREVDAALSEPEASPFQEYNLPDRPHPHGRQRPELRSQ